MAMEYLDGQPLVRALNRVAHTGQDFSVPMRLRIVADVLAGLQHAHTASDLMAGRWAWSTATSAPRTCS